MVFQLSESLDKDRVFLVKRSEVEERFDPNFYKPYSKKIDSRYDVVPLRKNALFIKHPPEYSRIYTEDGFQLIRSQNVRPDGIDLSNSPMFLAKEVTENKENIYPEIGDILVVRYGVNAGDTACIEVELPNTIVGADTLLLRFEKVVVPKFIQVFFSLGIGEEIMQRYLTGATNKHISPYYIGKIKIPLPPHDVQISIVGKMEFTYATKKQKEAQAQQLLDSIDSYLMNELGIETKSNYTSATENRIVKSNFKSFTGQRWDPLFHCGDMFSFIRNAQPKIDLPQLNNLVQYFQAGFAAGRDDQGEEHSGIIQIRPTNINDNRELVFHRNVYIDASELNERKTDVLNRDEVLFNNTNSQEQVGKTTYFDFEGDYFCSNHITRIATKTELLNPKYLCYILNLYQHQKCFFKLCTNWNNQSGVGVDVLQKIPIPLPPLLKQKEIADHIEAIRDQAKQLRAEAAVGLEQTKQEVEAMILGETCQ